MASNPEPRNFKRYLGDGAYVDAGSYAGEIVLTAENGIRVTDRVVLGPTEMHALCDWIRSIGWGDLLK